MEALLEWIRFPTLPLEEACTLDVAASAQVCVSS